MCDQPLLNTDQLASYLGVTKSWIHDQVMERRLPHFKLGRQLRFRRIDIDGWLATCQREPVNRLPQPRRRSA